MTGTANLCAVYDAPLRVAGATCIDCGATGEMAGDLRGSDGLRAIVAVPGSAFPRDAFLCAACLAARTEPDPIYDGNPMDWFRENQLRGE